MNNFIVKIAITILLIVGIPSAYSEVQKNKPNIVLILADDLGWSDIGCYGGEIKTPNIDALASGGLRFTQFYNSARCCPTRASLLTGLYPHQAGVGGMNNDRGVEFPGYRGTLHSNTVTLAEVLKQAGYKTYMVGKWHLHNQQDIKPTDRGFDEFYGMLGGFNTFWEETPYYTRLPADRSKRQYTSAKNGKPGTFYSTDVFADYSIDFINEAAKEQKPFFLYLAFNAPHFPLHAHPEDIEKYEKMYFEKGWDKIREERLERQKQLGLIPKDLKLPPRSVVPPKLHARPSVYAGKENPAWNSLPQERRRDLARRMAVYAAMVDRMDVAIGRVVNELKRLNLFENTMIIFMSDNGACWEWDPYGFDESSSPKNILHMDEDLKNVGLPSSYISYGSGWANACNTPFRLYKHFCYEGGIRTPFIVCWQAGIKARGEIRNQPGHIIDIMPTLIEAARARYPSEFNGIKIQPMEGVSLFPAFENKSLKRKSPLFFEHEGSRGVIDGEWKLVSLTADFWELYNLKEDPTEMNNLASSMPSKVQNLAKKWYQWAERCNVDLFGYELVLEPPQIAQKKLEIQCDVTLPSWSKNERGKPSPSGVLISHGGNRHGYAIYIQNGKLFFGVRVSGQLYTVETDLPNKTNFRVIGKLDRDASMTLLVNGKILAKGKASGLIPEQPMDELCIGRDTRTAVGNYNPPFRFLGRIENFRVVAE